MMNKYLDEPRLIFRDTIKNNLIGPGSDVFTSDSEEEIISDYPLSRYFSGILFPERETEKTIGEKEDHDASAEIEDDENDVQLDIDSTNAEDSFEADSNESTKAPKSEDGNDYSEANQYFPTNFGLTFCVPKETEKLKITFKFAKYRQLKKDEAKVEISLNDFELFTKHNYYPLNDLLVFENGFVFLNPKSSFYNLITVYNFGGKNILMIKLRG